MTWEETIKSIQNKPDFSDLVRDAYLSTDLQANVERYKTSDEFREVLRLLGANLNSFETLADVGSGNGIGTLAFALEGIKVFSIEPDPSYIVGAGAIRTLTNYYGVTDRVKIVERYGEDTGLDSNLVDVVFIRQAMHHAQDLDKMMQECFRILKPAGILLTIRDHVIFDDDDKSWFLKSHPLHRYYGGENAYSEKEYTVAMEKSGFRILNRFRFFESIINYFPLTREQVERLVEKSEQKLIKRLEKRIGSMSRIKIVQHLCKKYVRSRIADVYDERKIPGRMYSFLAEKPSGNL